MFLTQSDLRSLTGYKQPSAVARWLRTNGFVFVVGVDGWPRVALSHFDARMSGNVKQTRRTEPNLQALQEMQSGKTA